MKKQNTTENNSGQNSDKKKNKAAYTAIQVACGWAVAVVKKAKHLGRSSSAGTTL